MSREITDLEYREVVRCLSQECPVRRFYLKESTEHLRLKEEYANLERENSFYKEAVDILLSRLHALLSDFGEVPLSLSDLSRELKSSNWEYIVPLMKNSILAFDLKRKIPNAVDLLILAAEMAEKTKRNDIDSEVITAAKTHLIHAMAFEKIGNNRHPEMLEQSRKHLERALEIFQISTEVDKVSRDLSLERLHLNNLKKVDEIEGKPVYTI